LSCILIVEDDHAVREAVSDALLDAGYNVAKAIDGADGLDQARQHPPDAILLDLMMPDMDGWTFLDTVMSDKSLERIPIGIMSAAPLAHHTAQARGVQITVAKPFALDDLLSQVESLLAPLKS
jgi:CheY-like chemotaxis protein